LNKDLEEVRGEPCRQLRKANRLRKQHVQRAQLVYHRDTKEVSRAEAKEQEVREQETEQEERTLILHRSERL
jgi:hypothetical protein